MHQKNLKYALIIGATGGIGFAITRLLLEKGIFVFASYRSNNSNNEVENLKKQYKNIISINNVDITDATSIARAFSDIKNTTDKLDIIINCSGLLHSEQILPEKKIEDINAEMMVKSFATNSIGPALIAKYALEFLRHENTSILANLSARVGSITDNYLGGWYSYRASKAAQNMFTKTLSIELKRRSPNTICVGLHPGTVETKLSKPFSRNVKPEQLHNTNQAANDLYRVIKNLRTEDSGKVFDWQGKEIAP